MIEIPLVNLKRQHRKLSLELNKAFSDVVNGGGFVQGAYVEKFERAFEVFQGVENGVGCSNGTVAIELALRTLGVGIGDEVILPSHTFIATAEAVCAVGATPLFADVSPDSHVLTAQTVLAVATSQTRAIIPVHIYGFPCPMTELMDLARERNWLVIEDCAQAHGSKLNNKALGSYGDAATFSFYPGKNLGALGDAGLVAFKCIEKFNYAKRLRNHGRVGKYEHDFIGFNFRMDEIQAAFLMVKLKHIERWNDNRTAVALFYENTIKNKGFKIPQPIEGAEPSYHLFVVEVANRDALLASMKATGIGCGVHYPIPCHQQKAVMDMGSPSHLPVSETLAKTTISLPICGEIEPQEAEKVVTEFIRLATPADFGRVE